MWETGSCGFDPLFEHFFFKVCPLIWFQTPLPPYLVTWYKNKSFSKCVQAIEERNDIERQLLQEQNARILQDQILANHLHKQKELKMAQEKISSQVLSSVSSILDFSLCICICMCAQLLKTIKGLMKSTEHFSKFYVAILTNTQFDMGMAFSESWIK